MISEANGGISTNRVAVLILTLAAVYSALVQRDATTSATLLGFAFGNKHVGKVLENKARKEK